MLTSVDVSATHFDVSSQFVDASFKRFKLEIWSLSYNLPLSLVVTSVNVLH